MSISIACPPATEPAEQGLASSERCCVAKPLILLKSLCPQLPGKSWKSEVCLRVGRIKSLEIVLNHASVSRRHAEVVHTERGWVVRDLGSTNGTFLNGVRIGQADRKLHKRDVLQFGQLVLTVATLREKPNREDHPSDTALPDTLVTPSSSPVKAVRVSHHDLFIQTVTALAQAVEMRDKYTGGHTQRVTNYSLLLADKLGLPAVDRRRLQIGTPLHDIGKIGVDDAILRKTGKLTPQEYDSMKLHPLLGVSILGSIPGLAPILPIVRSHHERWDGSGYPDGLRGEDIPRLARVVAVADVFDAMASDRPYRASLPLDYAFNELAAKAGSQFDAVIVEAFLQLRPRLEEMVRQQKALIQTQADVNLEVNPMTSVPHFHLAGLQ